MYTSSDNTQEAYKTSLSTDEPRALIRVEGPFDAHTATRDRYPPGANTNFPVGIGYLDENPSADLGDCVLIYKVPLRDVGGIKSGGCRKLKGRRR